ncbi:hypothetical protein H7H48_16915 [Nitratireductor sp. B36]|uniref:hypothetical protein n=1 Tax=Nitratireductor sp. B36 TaxID=2762059 RepID=UPI001E3D68CE|nr:hypothetical protein [Nitratireductor sp. B36]MCC5780746.1 hypothetical protein [Nitratireductor sp. B36]
MKPNLLSLKAVRATDKADVFVATLDFELLDPQTGELIETVTDAEYGVVPEDTFGLSPQVVLAVAEWIAQGRYITPYSSPTSEELRAMMPSLSARELRLGLIANGIALASVQEAVDAITDLAEREKAQVEWEYAGSFERTHALIAQIADYLALTPEQVDAMWLASAS